MRAIEKILLEDAHDPDAWEEPIRVAPSPSERPRRLEQPDDSVYFIAEIGANHEGSLTRACWLIDLAARHGANCVKFQHYKADTLASEKGFDRLKSLAHYSDNPYRVFRQFEVPWEWTPILAEACRQSGVDFMSTPYDIATVDHLDPYVKAFKIGSGDITYEALIHHVALKDKPIFISTGASDRAEVFNACNWVYKAASRYPKDICLMQCNTNYELDREKGQFANLNVLKSFDWQYVKKGYSDHTLGYTTAVGAVALGAKVIEKHFTDDRSRSGSPDHPFATEPGEFAEMVQAVRLLESALGDGIKVVQTNERETVVLQRRCLRAARDLPAGHVLTPEDVVALRPAPEGSMPPYQLKDIVGKKLEKGILHHEEFMPKL